MSEPYTLDADLYPDTSNIVTEDDTSKHDFPSDIDLSPDISHIITEDDTPGDNFASEKLQRLLVESLYNAWTVPSDFQIFLAAAFEGRQDVWLRWCNREGNECIPVL
jgi:hypothetical protein